MKVICDEFTVEVFDTDIERKVREIILNLSFDKKQKDKPRETIKKPVAAPRNHWSEEDEDILVELFEEGWSGLQIADRMKRTFSAISNRLWILRRDGRIKSGLGITKQEKKEN